MKTYTDLANQIGKFAITETMTSLLKISQAKYMYILSNFTQIFFVMTKQCKVCKLSSVIWKINISATSVKMYSGQSLAICHKDISYSNMHVMFWININSKHVYILSQRARNFKKVQANKLVKSNKSNSFFVKLRSWQF